MRNLLLLMSLIIVSITSSVAQTPIEENTEIFGDFRQAFSKLQVSHIPYGGALRDQAVEMADFDLFDGLHPDVYSNQDDFIRLLKSARTLYSSYPSWQAEDVMSALYESNNLSECAVGILLFNYAYIKETALSDSLISFDGEYVYDMYKDGVWQNPYEKSRIFSMAPSDTIFYNTVNFSFSSDFYKTNTGGIFEFDPGDGEGYRIVGYGSPNSSLSVVYTNSGEHTLQLRITSGTESYLTRCKIYTIDETSTTRSTQGYECQDITSEYQGQTVVGKLWKKRRITNHLKPFLIVEGFDVSFLDNKNKTSNYEAYGELSLPRVWNEIDFLSQDYDVYYLDLESPTLKIEANATLLEEALAKIEEDKATYSYSDDNIIMGSSMGGLITRYCLRDMEIRGVKHHTQTMICQDTPNLGANVPLSVLYGVHALNKLYGQVKGKIIKEVRQPIHLLNSIVYSDSAKEMLINYVDENGNIDNSAYNEFMHKLHTMGYPIGDNGTLRSLAISNGNSTCLDANDVILKATASFTSSALSEALLNIYRDFVGVGFGLISPNLLVSAFSFIIGSTRLEGNLELYPVGSTKSNNLINFVIHYKKKVFWIADFSTKLFNYKKQQPKNVVSYDLARTSYYDMTKLNEIDFKNLHYSVDPKGIHLGDVNSQIDCVQQIPFIPTVSALDIGEFNSTITQSDLDVVYSMEGARPGGDKYIPFDGYYITASAGNHIAITPEIVTWLNDQLKLSITGDDIAFTGSKYSIINNTKGYSIEWSSSDDSIATINEEGVVTAYKHGYVTLKATLSNGQTYPKYVMVDFPKYNIEVTNYENYVRFTCSQYTDSSVFFKMFSPYIKLQVAESDVVFAETKVNYYDVSRTNGGGITVYYRPVYTSKDHDIYGEVVSTSASTAYPYILEPSYFILNEHSGISTVTIKKNPCYYQALPDEFMIYYFESHGGTPLYATAATSLDVNVENVFSSSQIEEFKKNVTVRSISNDFVIRGKKGNTIQRFKVTYIR